MKQHIARKRFGQNFLTDTRIIDRIVHGIQPQENDRREEGRPLVTIPKGVVASDSEGVVCRETGQVGGWLVDPPLLRPGESRLQSIFVTDADQAPVFTDLIEMSGFDD